MAARTGHVKLHAPAGLGDLAGTAALRAFSGGLDESLPVAVGTSVAPGDVQPHHSTPNRRPKRHIHLILEILTGLRAFVRGAAPPPENAGENIAEAAAAATTRLAPARTFEHVGKIKAAEIELAAMRAGACRLASGKTATTGKSPGISAGSGIGLGRGSINVVGIEADLIVDFSFLGIAEDVVGFGDGLELLLRGLVSRIDVRMIFAGKFTERLADVVSRGRLLYSEDFVVVLLGGGCRSA
jgi:hypothetical protein